MVCGDVVSAGRSVGAWPVPVSWAQGMPCGDDALLLVPEGSGNDLRWSLVLLVPEWDHAITCGGRWLCWSQSGIGSGSWDCGWRWADGCCWRSLEEVSGQKARTDCTA